MVLVVDELKQKLREIALRIEELRRDVMALERQQAPSTSSSEPTEPVRNQSSFLVVASGTDRMPTAFLISPGTSIAGASTSAPGRTACAGVNRLGMLAPYRRPILALTQIWCNSLMSRRSGELEADQAFRDRTSGASPA